MAGRASGYSALVTGIRNDRPFDDAEAVIFDMDGVVTNTGPLHAESWREAFDDHLARHHSTIREGVEPFDVDADYRTHLDGRNRHEGAARLLASRSLDVPFGTPADDRDGDTACGLANRKDACFHALVSQRGVETFTPTVRLVHALREQGVAVALVTSSHNAERVLVAAGLGDVFDVRVDGVVADELGLPGKPDPAPFLEAARRLEVAPSAAVVIEDSTAGVEAARRGGFGLVIGVAHQGGDPAALRQAGADVVVADLAELPLPRRPIELLSPSSLSAETGTPPP
jgi:beta-phosphoglucomutase family hydrolase